MKYPFLYEILFSIIRIIPVNMTHQKLLRLVVWYVLKLFAVVHQTYLCIEKKIMNERAKKSLKGKLWTLLNPPTFSTPQFIFSLNRVFQSSPIFYSTIKISKKQFSAFIFDWKAMAIMNIYRTKLYWYKNWSMINTNRLTWNA